MFCQKWQNVLSFDTMMRTLIRIAALIIIVGGIYLVKNVGKTVVEQEPQVNKLAETKVETTQNAEDVKNSENLEAIETSLEKIEKFTQKDESINTQTEKKLILQKIKSPVVLAPKTVNTNNNAKITNKKTETPKTWPISKAKVYMYDFGIDLSTKTFPVGDITFTVNNNGLFAHQFAIEGIKNYGLVGRNATETFTVRITKPGTYKIWSEKEIDKKHEMYEYIVVE